uniref:Immunoglobulin V-set domain-containing protein n=1 Tax=Poecilia mexicana TaxID=48701 RepID=A0A3B3WSI4_9TELE
SAWLASKGPNQLNYITVQCEFGYSGTKRFFCKETCEGENILIGTTKDRDENGRFSIRYEGRNIFSSDFLYVSITDLKPSDSGQYRCRSDTWKGILYNHFNLTVIEVSIILCKCQILNKLNASLSTLKVAASFLTLMQTESVRKHQSAKSSDISQQIVQLQLCSYCEI